MPKAQNDPDPIQKINIDAEKDRIIKDIVKLHVIATQNFNEYFLQLKMGENASPNAYKKYILDDRRFEYDVDSLNKSRFVDNVARFIDDNDEVSIEGWNRRVDNLYNAFSLAVSGQEYYDSYRNQRIDHNTAYHQRLEKEFWPSMYVYLLEENGFNYTKYTGEIRDGDLSSLGILPSERSFEMN